MPVSLLAGRSCSLPIVCATKLWHKSINYLKGKNANSLPRTCWLYHPSLSPSLVRTNKSNRGKITVPSPSTSQTHQAPSPAHFTSFSSLFPNTQSPALGTM